MDMNYEIVDKAVYYRSGVFRHFTEDCKCSTSMTARIDVSLPDLAVSTVVSVLLKPYRHDGKSKNSVD